jgi:glycogen debranching enzyme
MGKGIHNYIEDSSCLWVSLLRTVYEATGDRALVDHLWPTLETVMKWFLERRTERGLVLAREFYLHFDNPIAYMECEGATLNALVYRALAAAAALARHTGRKSRAAHFARAASALATAYNHHLWCEESGPERGMRAGCAAGLPKDRPLLRLLDRGRASVGSD